MRVVQRILLHIRVISLGPKENQLKTSKKLSFATLRDASRRFATLKKHRKSLAPKKHFRGAKLSFCFFEKRRRKSPRKNKSPKKKKPFLFLSFSRYFCPSRSCFPQQSGLLSRESRSIPLVPPDVPCVSRSLDTVRLPRSSRTQSV